MRGIQLPKLGLSEIRKPLTEALSAVRDISMTVEPFLRSDELEEAREALDIIFSSNASTLETIDIAFEDVNNETFEFTKGPTCESKHVVITLLALQPFICLRELILEGECACLDPPSVESLITKSCATLDTLSIDSWAFESAQHGHVKDVWRCVLRAAASCPSLATLHILIEALPRGNNYGDMDIDEDDKESVSAALAKATSASGDAS